MLTLEESGRRAGGHCWVERSLFSLFGRWVAGGTDAATKLLVDRHSQHHAWRAAQWWDRLPVVADVEREALVAAPSPGWAAALGALGATPDPLGRLAGAYRVALPRLGAAYRADVRAADGPGDGAVRRTLGIVLPDLVDDWVEGEAHLQGLLADPEAIGRVSSLVDDLERHFLVR